MANRPIVPMTGKFMGEFVQPRGHGELPPLNAAPPDFELPYARFFIDEQGQEQVEYGRTLRLSSFKGQPVLLELTRIASDRLF